MNESPVAAGWLKPLARKTFPDPARRWLRVQQERICRRKQGLYDKLIVRRRFFTNQERILNFNFALTASRKQFGVSGLLRVKNEEEKIYHCLASIYDVFDEIVLVDNNSEDTTLTVVRQFVNTEDKLGKIRLYSYPFKIARCGPEHFDTADNSVHSLVYYYNWALSKCSLRYVCKWDGDMVLTREARTPFKQFLNRIQRGKKMWWRVFGQSIYRDSAGNYFLAKGETNGEIRIFPNGFNPRFYKADLYEILRSEPPIEEGQFDGPLFYELKFVNTDEFSHWSIRDIPTERKKRELENFQLVKRNETSSARFQKLPRNFLDDQIG